MWPQQRVVPVTATQQPVLRAVRAVDQVVASLAEQGIDAETADERVIARTAEELISAGAAGRRVFATAAVQPVRRRLPRSGGRRHPRRRRLPARGRARTSLSATRSSVRCSTAVNSWQSPASRSTRRNSLASIWSRPGPHADAISARRRLVAVLAFVASTTSLPLPSEMLATSLPPSTSSAPSPTGTSRPPPPANSESARSAPVRWSTPRAPRRIVAMPGEAPTTSSRSPASTLTVSRATFSQRACCASTDTQPLAVVSTARRSSISTVMSVGPGAIRTLFASPGPAISEGRCTLHRSSTCGRHERLLDDARGRRPRRPTHCAGGHQPGCRRQDQSSHSPMCSAEPAHQAPRVLARGLAARRTLKLVVRRLEAARGVGRLDRGAPRASAREPIRPLKAIVFLPAAPTRVRVPLRLWRVPSREQPRSAPLGGRS